MDTSKRLVITGIELAEFVQRMQSQCDSSILIICSSKETFVERLLAACPYPQRTGNDEQPGLDEEANEKPDDPSKTEPHALLKKLSLLDLAKSRKVKLAFCPDITHLRAYLAVLAAPRSDQAAAQQNTISKHQLLAILNPIEAHRPTSAFSAQGLNRTFALAVEAAHTTARSLLMVECPSKELRDTDHPDAHSPFEEESAQQPQPADPWDEEVSILNVTTKSFGVGGRGWVGRTITIRKIAERWCQFSALDPGRDEV